MKRIALALALSGCTSPDSPAHDDDDAAETTTSSSTGEAPTSDPSSSSGAPDTTEAGSESSSGASSTGEPEPEPEPWVWELPPNFPEPYVPEDNAMSAAKVELGRHLFYDTRLSGNGTYACATCHQQELAFTDGLPHAIGSTGDEHPRGSMSLANIAYASTLAWGNPTLLELEDHAPGPMFGDAPIELGLVDEDDAVARIIDDPVYADLFAAAYPDDDDAITFDNIVKAIASFQRTLISGRAPFDRWFFDGDESAVSDAAKRGWDVFNFPGECTYCHFSFNFTDATYFASLPEWSQPFHNTGLYDIDGAGSYPPPNTGLYAFTDDPQDMGKFKSPTLRNIALTAPYMHDGSIATLDEVLDHYQVGGRAHAQYTDFQMKTFELTQQERADLIAFFESLTDESFLTNPAFADPWPATRSP